MPTYEYACTSCKQQREVVQRMTDDSLTTCEACGGALRKVIFPVGVVFKGAGFYRTDSRSTQTGRNGSSTSEDKGSGEKGDAKTSGSGESNGSTSKDGGSSESGGSSGSDSSSSSSSNSSSSSGSSSNGSTKSTASAGASTS
ncbi:MAG: FmdB family zinc ribbon protein [Streptosporangiales bacterium]